MLADPAQGHLRFSGDEVEAVRRVTAVESERGLLSGVGAQGGFAIPFTLDPSVMLTSSGALNPIRSVASVITVATREWKGVSSAGVTASYDAEASEVSDDTPTLAQPTITTAMGRAFVPYSIEAGQDWGGLQQELAKMISDGRDVLDSVQFLTGTGTDSPAGVLTGLSTTQRVQTAGAGAIAVGDVYALKAAIRPRDIPNATFAFHPNRVDSIYRLTPSGSTTEPQMLPTRDGPLLGKRVVEWTNMATASTTTTKWALYGDFRAGFRIADRLGMTAELIPTLFGASRRPTGERGLFAYWRTGSKVIVPEALRYGEVL
jgi:HK97 family phage major capsid protein